MRNSRIPGWMIFVGFCIGFWPGLILLIIRILQGASSDNAARRAQEQRERTGQRTYQPPRGATVHTVDYQPVRETNSRTYQPPQGAAQAPNMQQQAQGPAQNQQRQYYRPPTNTQPNPPEHTLTRRQRELISGKGGKGMWVGGLITLGSSIFAALLVVMAGLADGEFLFEVFMASAIVAAAGGIPGAVLTIVGNQNRNRAARCRNYIAMLGSNKRIDMDEMAAAIPTNYDQVRKDLQWMLDEGFFPGFYVDSMSRCLIHPDARTVKKQPEPAPAPEKPAAGGRKTYPDERRIRAINDRIDDEYISERMDRLEELTHNIFAYVEDHPEKEKDLRQFRSHYLPTTLKILESYARFEKQGVDGENISSAMNDVKAIMDKLVTGFERQLDALYAAEALDVSTDISVLENMLSMEGLGPLSPFGKQKNQESN